MIRLRATRSNRLILVCFCDRVERPRGKATSRLEVVERLWQPRLHATEHEISDRRADSQDLDYRGQAELVAV